MPIEALRTPDDRFADLPDFPWEPSYVDDLPGYEGLRMHYLDLEPEGGAAADAPVFLCLHGEPSWCFLYRKMIPVFLEAGGRVVAPDFYGFGKSDKPVDDAVYTWDFHRNSILRFIERLDLKRVTLVVQDWGGLIGLTLPLEGADRYERLLVMNTALGTGKVPPSEGFVAWRDFVANSPDFNVGGLMSRAIPNLADADRAAYDAPFPTAEHKAGVRRFPAIVPVSEDMDGATTSQQAAAFWMDTWRGPTFMAVGAQDPVLGVPVMKKLASLIHGCPDPMILQDAGHFAQESGEAIARAALEAWKA